MNQIIILFTTCTPNFFINGLAKLSDPRGFYTCIELFSAMILTNFVRGGLGGNAGAGTSLLGGGGTLGL
jgi:hypothetical protein